MSSYGSGYWISCCISKLMARSSFRCRILCELTEKDVLSSFEDPFLD